MADPFFLQDIPRLPQLAAALPLGRLAADPPTEFTSPGTTRAG
jgi:hypothetical protein